MLRLDVDRKRPIAIGRLGWLLRRAGYRPVTLMQTRSPSGRGWHVMCDIDPVPSELETVTLQAILGSDVAREACNLQRVRMLPKVSPYWQQRFNVLYTAYP